MRLICGPVFTSVEANPGDEEFVRAALTLEDPSAGTNPAFLDGTWDGVYRLYNEVRGAFYTGYLKRVLAHLRAHRVQFELENPPEPGLNIEVPSDLFPTRPFWLHQQRSIEQALLARRGVLRVAMRGGKTNIEIGLAEVLDQVEGGCQSLLLTGEVRPLEQHYQRFLSLGVSDVGRVGNGHAEWGHRHIVGVVPALLKGLMSGDPETLHMLATRRLLLIDEVHHLGSADTWAKVAEECPAPWRFGFSGTPFRASGREIHASDLRLMGLTGSLIVDVSSTYLRRVGILAAPLLMFVPMTDPKVSAKTFKGAYEQGIETHILRNRAIVNIAANLAREGRRTLILVKHKRHGDILLEGIARKGLPALYATGANRTAVMSGLNRFEWSRHSDAVMDHFVSGRIPTMVATPVFDEAIDIPAVDAVIVAGGGKSRVKTLQRAFRGMTGSEGKSQTLIFDFNDQTSYVLAKHSRERYRLYQGEEIPIELDVKKFAHYLRGTPA